MSVPELRIIIVIVPKLGIIGHECDCSSNFLYLESFHDFDWEIKLFKI